MKAIVKILSAALLLANVASAQGYKPTYKNTAPDCIGKDAEWPKFDPASHITGPQVSPETLKGKYVIFEYWALGCGPCIISLKHLKTLANDVPADKLVIITSYVRPPDPAVKEYLDKNEFPFSSYQGLSLANFPCYTSIPLAVFIGPDGKIIEEGRPMYIIDIVRKTLKVPEKPTATSKPAPAATSQPTPPQGK